MKLIVFINGLVLVFGSVLMAVDAVLFGATAAVFYPAALLTFTTGLCLCLVSYSSFAGFRARDTFLLTASVWMTAAAFGTLPLFMWSMPLSDAFFEAMSGITTTGSTVMSGLDSTPPGILIWRAVLQWLGGVGFIVTGIALLPMLRVGGMQLFRSESSDQGEKELKSSAKFAAATLWVYLTLSMSCMALYLLGGMGAFDAVVHAMTTLSSGGFSNYDASFGHFDSAFLQWTATLFMLCAGLPFAWFIRAAHRRVFRSEQVTFYLSGLAVVIVLITLWRVTVHDVAPMEALRTVAFHVVSTVTTTGYATSDYTKWGPAAVAVFFLLMAVGGCAGSTAGGAKTMRWILLFRSLGQQLRLIRHPHGIFTIRYEGRRVEPGVLDGVTSFFVVYFFTFAVLAVLLDFSGLDFATATSGALTALANVGPGVGDIIGPAGNFSSLPDSAKWVLAFGMYVGRLEMLTVLVLLTPVFWREELA